MRADGLTVELRLRTPWEATDLGIALTRAHAAKIWGAWCLVTLPAFVLLHALLWPFELVWLAGLLLWWLKPVFDRIPLYVLSRAALGAAPGVRETVRAQWRWGWRGILPWLLWRRLHPSRSLLLPIDLLEQLTGARRSDRVRVLARAEGAPHVLLTVLGVHLELMLALSIVMFAVMLIPFEFMSESFRATWETLFDDMPPWLVALYNAVYWIAVGVIEPFYVGAGFGLYLNRRTQLEAWDIELAFRRIAARLAAPLLLALALALPAATHAPPAVAAVAAEQADADVEREDEDADDAACDDAEDEDAAACDVDATSLEQVFASGHRDDGKGFADAANRAFDSEELSPKSTITRWKSRDDDDGEDSADSGAPAWAQAIGGLVALLIEYGLWIAIAVLLIVLLVNHRRWMPWLADRIAPGRRPEPVALHAVADPEAPLPDDIPGAVRALWQQGYARAALALLYRAAVVRLTDTVGTPLPPGATEADCVRHARRLREHPFAAVFVAIVRCWQAAAYAARLPDGAQLERLLADWDASRSTPA